MKISPVMLSQDLFNPIFEPNLFTEALARIVDLCF
jgi:hypothetical protein